MKLHLAEEIAKFGAYTPMSRARLHASKLVKNSAKACAFELYKPEKMKNPNIMALIRGNGFASQVLAACTYKEVCGEFDGIVFSVDAIHKPDNAVIECKYCGNASSCSEIPDDLFGKALAQLLFYTALYNKSKTTKQYKGKTCPKLKTPISLLIVGLRNSVEVWGFKFTATELSIALKFYKAKVATILDAEYGNWDEVNEWDSRYVEGDWHAVLDKAGIDKEIKLKGSTLIENQPIVF